MKGLRLLNNGEWNKPPVLTAARQIFALALGKRFPKCTLGDAASFLNGTSYDVTRISTLAPSPIIRISNVTDSTSAYIRTDEDLGAKFWIRLDDLLVSWSASFKSAIWAGPEGYLNQHIFKVTENSGFDRRYIRHIIEGSFDAMQDRVVGIGMMHLRRADFLGHRIAAPPLGIQVAIATYLDWMEGGRLGTEPPLPPELDEQRRVVARIEELAGQIQEARSLRDGAIQAAYALWQSSLAELFHPEVAIQRPLVDACAAIIDNLHSTPKYDGDEYACIRSQDVGWGGINYETARRTSAREYFERTRRSTPKNGDVVFVREGDVGRCAVIDGSVPFSLGQRVMMFRPKDDVNSTFLMHQLMSPPVLVEQILHGKSGTTSHHVNIKHLRQVKVNVPSRERQVRVLTRLDTLRAKLSELSSLQTEGTTQLDALLPAVLDRAFKGELV